MVDLRDLGIAGENYYHSPRNPPYWRRIDGAVPDLLVRRSVGERLLRINAVLGLAELELFVFDAWRPKAVQSYFHDVWMPAELKRRKPELHGAAFSAELERYWAAPSGDEDSPAPHATGAALDLTIRWIGSDALWMGSIFDDVTALAHRDHFEGRDCTSLSFSDDEARANRRLLHWAMAEGGFAGHPDEWWHYSWGDQLWAALLGQRLREQFDQHCIHQRDYEARPVDAGEIRNLHPPTPFVNGMGEQHPTDACQECHTGVFQAHPSDRQREQQR